MLMQDPNLLAYMGCIDPKDRDFYGTPPVWIQTMPTSNGWH